MGEVRLLLHPDFDDSLRETKRGAGVLIHLGVPDADAYCEVRRRGVTRLPRSPRIAPGAGTSRCSIRTATASTFSARRGARSPADVNTRRRACAARKRRATSRASGTIPSRQPTPLVGLSCPISASWAPRPRSSGSSVAASVTRLSNPKVAGFDSSPAPAGSRAGVHGKTARKPSPSAARAREHVRERRDDPTCYSRRPGIDSGVSCARDVRARDEMSYLSAFRAVLPTITLVSLRVALRALRS